MSLRRSACAIESGCVKIISKRSIERRSFGRRSCFSEKMSLSIMIWPLLFIAHINTWSSAQLRIEWMNCAGKLAVNWKRIAVEFGGVLILSNFQNARSKRALQNVSAKRYAKIRTMKLNRFFFTIWKALAIFCENGLGALRPYRLCRHSVIHWSDPERDPSKEDGSKFVWV